MQMSTSNKILPTTVAIALLLILLSSTFMGVAFASTQTDTEASMRKAPIVHQPSLANGLWLDHAVDFLANPTGILNQASAANIHTFIVIWGYWKNHQNK
jgi:hypothetical protein